MTTVLVTGATGYVGGRLVPRLLERGHTVRAVARSLGKLRARTWSRNERCELAEADVFDPGSLARALAGCDAAFYLVHSMGAAHAGDAGDADFAERDRTAAQNFLDAATTAGVGRIIYLGGLGDDSPDLSPHLRSRAEVGRILQSGTPRTTWLRAAVILGSGSASFEIIRSLVDRLPVMLTPRWVDTPCQPIAISDVLAYLAGCLETPETAGLTLDIGGPEQLSYRKLFHIYAEEAGLRPRLILAVPVLTPALSAHWVNLVTPVPRALVRPLIEGLRNKVLCKDERILELVPIARTTCRQALRQALNRVAMQAVESCCFDAGNACAPEWSACHDAPFAGGSSLESSHTVRLGCDPTQAWKPVARIGGDTGWYFGDRLWALRGFVDKLLGGPGLRRGRRHPVDIHEGDALDFWRVASVTENQRLLLVAEMKLPGEALLEFRLQPVNSSPDLSTDLEMRALFLPRGLAGQAYWWAMYPFHLLLFKNMLRNLAKAANAPILSGPTALRSKP
ncbi:MAG: SDR family oxidoreductase [Desulfovibrio sp.]